jgi:hypothetical protein
LATRLYSVENLEERQLLTINPSDLLITSPPGGNNWSIVSTVNLPTMSVVSGPSGVNAPGEPFDPAAAGITLGHIPNLLAPDISEWTRTAQPDESISITGDDFSMFQGGLTRFFVFVDSGLGPGRIIAAHTQSVLGDNRATITLPTADLPANEMYLLWAVDDDGVSKPVAVNQTEAWWIGPNAGQAGQTIAIFGRNLTKDGLEWVAGQSSGPANSWVWIQSTAGGPAIAVQVTSANPYRVEFQLPSNLAAGNYRAWVHNGRGGSFGWGAPLEFTVRSAAQNGTSWTGPVFDITNTPELAQMLSNSASANDAALLQTVLSRAGLAQNIFSTVVLPAGTFNIDAPLNLPSNVRLVGQGMDQTILKARASSAFNLSGMFYSNGAVPSSNVVFSNLTLHSGYNPLGLSDQAYTGGIEFLIRFFAQRDVRFDTVRFESRPNDSIFMSGCNRTTFINSEFYGDTPLFLEGCDNNFVVDCDFFLTNIGQAAISNWGGDQFSVTNSRAQSLDMSDLGRNANWGLRFFVNAKGGRFKYFSHNVTTNLGMSPQTSANIGEQFLWEGPDSEYIVKPTSSTANTVTVTTSESVDYSRGDHYVVVLQGQGVGQTRRITGATVNGTTVTLQLENPLAVLTDSTSLIAVTQMADRIAIYKNQLQGLAENAQRNSYIGPAGIMLFGGTSNFHIDSNTLHDIRLPIAIFSVTQPGTVTPLAQPSIFHVISNNEILRGRFGIVINAYGGLPVTSDPTINEWSSLTGLVLRGNDIHNSIVSGIEVVNVGRNGEMPVNEIVDTLVIEHNNISNVSTAITLSVGLTIDYRGPTASQAIVRDALIRKNILTHRTDGLPASPASNAIVVGNAQTAIVADNQYTGFATQINNGAPVTVRATTTPGVYQITLNGYDLDRKGGGFRYSIDWDNNGVWDTLPEGTYIVDVNGTYTLTRAVTGTRFNPRFRIVNLGDIYQVDFRQTYVADVLPTATSVPLSAAVLVGPTANARQFSFTLFADRSAQAPGPLNAAFDWNNDGDFDDIGEMRTIDGSSTWTQTFAAAGVQNVRYRVWDAQGSVLESSLTIDSGRRDVHFFGSERADWIRFTEGTGASVTATLRRLAGRDVNRSFSFSNITGGVFAYGNGGPDWLDGGGLVSRSATFHGGTDSDTLRGGSANDTLFGGGPAGVFIGRDAVNSVNGGGGTNTISLSETIAPSAASANQPVSPALSVGMQIGSTFARDLALSQLFDASSPRIFSVRSDSPAAPSTDDARDEEETILAGLTSDLDDDEATTVTDDALASSYRR